MAYPTHYAVALFPGFQPMDVFGPLDALNFLSASYPLKLTILGPSLDPVSTLIERPGFNIKTGQSLVPTHTYDDAPEDIDVLIVPGGAGTRSEEISKPVEDVVAKWAKVLNEVDEESQKYLLTVCTGAAIAAKAGVLDGRRATSNKRAFDWVSIDTTVEFVGMVEDNADTQQVTEQGPRVDWVRKARWVEDGHVWSSSGVTAGMDMMYAFIASKYGEEDAEKGAIMSEYVRNTDSTNDPFADLYK